MEFVTQLVAGSAAVSGILVVRRWLGWRPGDAGAGSVVRHHGVSWADRAGDATEGAGRFAGRIAGGVVRGGGSLAARSMGASIDLLDGVVTRLVPGTRGRPEADTATAGATTAATTKTARPGKAPAKQAARPKKAPAKKSAAKQTARPKKSAAKKTAAKKTAAKKTAAKTKAGAGG